MINAVSEAGTESTVVPSQEPFQLQKTTWAPHNESTAVVLVDWNKMVMPTGTVRANGD